MRSRLLERLLPAGRSDSMKVAAAESITGISVQLPSSSRSNPYWRSVCLDGERRTAATRGLGVGILDGEATTGNVVDEVDLGAAEVTGAHRIDEQLHAVRFDDRVGGRVTFALIDH